MKNKFMKFTALTLAVITCMLLLASCDHIKDKNGPDDISVSFTEEELLARSVTYTPTADGKIKNEGNVYTYTDEKLSGIMNVCEIDPDSDKELKFEVDSEVLEGNLKIYVIRKSNTNVMVDEIPVGEEKIFTVTEPLAGEYVLRIAAESANMNIKVKVTNE